MQTTITVVWFVLVTLLVESLLPNRRPAWLVEAEAVAFACNGCHASTAAGTAGGAVSFDENGVSLQNGQCTGEPGHCTGQDCPLSGRLTFTNNTHTTLFWSDDGGTSTHALPSGDTEVVYFNDDKVKCSTESDMARTYTFYTNAHGTGQLAGAHYTLKCSKCQG